MKKALIVGFGHVGQSTVKYLKDIEVWVKDKDDEVRSLTTGEVKDNPMIIKADYWIICVPGVKDGKINTELVEEYICNAESCGAQPIVRTTLPLDYKRKNITYWPSFVTDYNTEEQRLVMSQRGYENGFCKYVTDGIMFLSLHDTTVVKLFANGYLATRVEFFNKVGDFSENVPAVINAICADTRIGDFYNYAERKRWGGKCFIKDMNELAQHDKFFEQVNESNKKRSK